ncbi:hypothetical protein [Bacillus sp. JJ1764]|uniref:hypothetical protein n=1 Tax=Bacillus sp. JJ1764 TaxID=3122964 RepID=UPI0030001703
MDKQQLANLVEQITRKLLENETPKKKVLFIFCDSSAHEPFVDQLILLKSRQIDYDLLFLDGETSAWLGIQQIQSTGAEQLIAADEYAKAPIELPKEYDAIIVPEIDLDNAARVCHGLKGSVKAEIIFSGLVLNIPIVIGEDSPGIKRAERRTLQRLQLPLPYQRKFEKYKLELAEMGIQFSKASELYETILQLLFEEFKEDSASIFFQEKVLTLKWLSTHIRNKKTLFVKEGTTLTPLVKDYLKEKGIKLVIQKEGSG